MSANHQLMDCLSLPRFLVTFSAIPKLTYPLGFVSGCHKSQRMFRRGILYSGEAKTWPLVERFELEGAILSVNQVSGCLCRIHEMSSHIPRLIYQFLGRVMMFLKD